MKAERKIVKPYSNPIEYEYYYVFESRNQLKELLKEAYDEGFEQGMFGENKDEAFEHWFNSKIEN